MKGSVSDLADLDRLYAEVKAERGTLDIVFANAGAGSRVVPPHHIRASELKEEHSIQPAETSQTPCKTAFSSSFRRLQADIR